jgi:hypothetical protein
MKKQEFVTMYIQNFYFDNTRNQWTCIAGNYRPTTENSKYYQIKIPVRTELLIEEIPIQEVIEIENA